MEVDVSESGKREARQNLNGDLRVALAAILAHAAALRDACDRNAEGSDRSALLDGIEREGRHALDVLERASADGRTPASEDRPKPRQPAYLVWLRSRLEQIETLSRAQRTDEVRQLALQLKESAASKGYREIAEAGGAVARLSEAGGAALEAGVEILRRTVNRVTRNVRSDAA